MTETVETRWEAHNEAGRRHFSQNEYAQAEQSFIAAIREATLLGADNARLATSLGNLAQLKYRQKDLAQAEALFRRSLAIRERVLGGDHVGLVQNLNNLAALHYARGELAQAEPLFRRALVIGEKDLGDNHPDAAVTLSNLARLYFRKNDFAAAAPLLLRLLSIKETTLGPNHPEVTAIVASLAKVRAAEGDLDAAEHLSRRALAAKEASVSPDDASLAPSLEALADVLAGRGRHDEEARLRDRAGRLRGHSPNATPAGGAAAPLTVQLKPPTVESSAIPDAPAAAAPRPNGVAPAKRSSGGTGVPSEPTTGTTRRVARPSGSTPRPAERTDPRTGSQRDSSTKSTTLPWIEPPTSPALRRPMPPREPEPVAQAATATAAPASSIVTRFVPPSPATTNRVEPVPHHVPSTKADDAHDALAHSAPVSAETTDSDDSDVFAPAPRRTWVKVLAAAVVLLVIGAGSWVLFMDHPAGSADSSTVSATAGSVALKAKRTHQAPLPASEVQTSSPAVPPPSPATTGSPASDVPGADRVAPPKAQPETKAGEPRHQELRSEGKTAAHPATGASAASADSIAAPETVLPSIDVNAVTNTIGEKAKQRVDSLGRTMTVKPPSFDKPKGQP